MNPYIVRNKYLIIVVFYLISISFKAQSTFQISATEASNFGNVYKLSIALTTPPLECKQRVVEVNLGILEYVDAVLPVDTWTVKVDPVNAKIILTNTVNNSSSGSQNIILKVRFKNGITCNGVTQRVKAILRSCIAPDNNLIQESEVTLIAKTKNGLKGEIYINHTSSNSKSTLCPGDMVSYTMFVRNDRVETGWDSDFRNYNSYNYKNIKLRINLPKCGTILAIARKNNEFINFTPSQGYVEIDVPDLNVGESYYLTVWNKYSCSATDCSDVFSAPTLNISAENNCEIGRKSIDFPPLIPDFKIGTGCANCNKYNIHTSNSYFAFICKNECSTNVADVVTLYNFSIYPGNTPTISDIYLEIDCPDGLRFQEYSRKYPDAFFRSNTPNGPFAWYSTPSSEYPTRKIRFKYTYDASKELVINPDVGYSTDGIIPSKPLEFTYRITNLNGDFVFYSDTIRNEYKAECQRVGYIGNSSVCKKNSNVKSISIQAVSSEVVTYRVLIDNISVTNTIKNFIIEDKLDSKLSYVPNSFRYLLSNKSDVMSSSLIELKDSTPNINIPELGGEIKVERSQNLIKLYGDNFKLPVNCKVGQRIYFILEFDVKIDRSVRQYDLIKNTISFGPDNEMYNVNSTGSFINTIWIDGLYRVDNEMFVKCANSDVWSKEIRVSNSDVLDFKMQIKNEGTIPIKLTDILNLKPMIGDRFEIGVNGSPNYRGSTCRIDYECSNPKIYGIAANPGAPLFLDPIVFTYSTNSVNMIRSMLTPPDQITAGDKPDFTKPCLGANWMRLNVKNDSWLLLNPGDIIEVVYKGKVTGNEGDIAINSFTFNAFSGIDSQIKISSNPSSPVIVNLFEIGNCLPPCYNCSSFDLIKKKKYLVSGWVKEEDLQSPTKQYKNYTNSSIKITFTDEAGVVITTPQPAQDGVSLLGNPEFFPTGDIIDGWQRIIGEFSVPENVDDMKLELLNKNTANVLSYFDDIRVLPSEGNMKSFVYDAKTQRLMAELDENNYSTFYEYDLEGGLIRIKKETEKGIFTIQETRSANVKK